MKYFQVHIPKTAGTAIRELTKSSSHKDLFCIYKPASSGGGHPTNGSLIYNKIPDNEKGDSCIFCSIRNPIDWYVSLFNHKMHSNPSPIKNYPVMEGNSWDNFYDDLVLMNHGIENCKKWFKPWVPYYDEIFKYAGRGSGCYSLFFAYYCFNNWDAVLSAKDINLELINRYKDSLAVNFILPIENLQNSFEEMMESNGTSCDIDLSLKVNVCPHKPSLEYYSPEQLDGLRKADQSIFKLFDYK